MNKFSNEQEKLNFDNDEAVKPEVKTEEEALVVEENPAEEIIAKKEKITLSKIKQEISEKIKVVSSLLSSKLNIFDESFKKRFLSALILAPLVLGIIYLGGILFVLMMAACAAIGVYEWGNMTLSDKKDQINSKIMPMGVAFSALSVCITGFVGNPAITLWILFSFCFFIVSFNVSNQGANINRFIFGIIYIVFSIEVMVWTRNFAPYGLYNTITLISMVWASDIFAYLSGKTIGGPKLAPSISPKKTWAGLIGGCLGAGFVGVFLSSTDFINLLNVDTIGNMHYVGYFVMGAVFAVLGQAGDLFISIVKRHYNIKDTGNLIPGHGGILDRIDALIFVAIIFGMLVVLAR